MKRVNFKTIKLQNFFSIGNDPVVVDFQKGLNIITGANRDKPDRRNALGKSAVAESLYFAVFGETLRGIKQKDHIINNITGGTTHVELDFEICTQNNVQPYKIIRNLNPSKVFLYKGGEDITRDSIKNTNKHIEMLLDATPSVFENCIIMTVNNSIPFMAKNKTEKRKFIEGICGMEIFSDMLSEMRSIYNETKRLHEIENTRQEEIKNSFEDFKTQRKNILVQRKETVKKIKIRQQEIIKEKKKLVEKLKQHKNINLQKLENEKGELSLKLEHYDDNIAQCTETCAELKAGLNHKKENFESIITSVGICPSCLKPIDEHDKCELDQKRKAISLKIVKIENDINKCNKNIDKFKTNKQKVKANIEKIETKLRECYIELSEKQNIKEQASQLQKIQKDLEKDLEENSSNETVIDEKIKETNQTLKTLQRKLTQLQNDLSTYDIIKYVISEEGVKSYIVNKLLELLNAKIIHYLKKLDTNIICVFNEFFEEEIFNEKGKVCSYFNFSGAERKTIDLACLFAFNDLRYLQGGVSYNVSIYDELFDSSFDEKGIELVLNVIKERIEKNNECVLVVSHRKESIKAVTGEVIFLEKINGITHRTEFVQM